MSPDRFRSGGKLDSRQQNQKSIASFNQNYGGCPGGCVPGLEFLSFGDAVAISSFLLGLSLQAFGGILSNIGKVLLRVWSDGLGGWWVIALISGLEVPDWGGFWGTYYV